MTKCGSDKTMQASDKKAQLDGELANNKMSTTHTIGEAKASVDKAKAEGELASDTKSTTEPKGDAMAHPNASYTTQASDDKAKADGKLGSEEKSMTETNGGPKTNPNASETTQASDDEAKADGKLASDKKSTTETNGGPKAKPNASETTEASVDKANADSELASDTKSTTEPNGDEMAHPNASETTQASNDKAKADGELASDKKSTTETNGGSKTKPNASETTEASVDNTKADGELASDTKSTTEPNGDAMAHPTESPTTHSSDEKAKADGKLASNKKSTTESHGEAKANLNAIETTEASGDKPTVDCEKASDKKSTSETTQASDHMEKADGTLASNRKSTTETNAEPKMANNENSMTITNRKPPDAATKSNSDTSGMTQPSHDKAALDQVAPAGEKRLLKNSNLGDPGKDSKKKMKSSWFEFAIYPEREFRSQGYYNCSLGKVANYVDAPDGIQFLAKRKLSKKKTKAPPSITGERNSTKAVHEEHDSRFAINFITASCNKGFEAKRGVWKVLSEFYNSYLEPVLKGEMNDGDQDDVFGVEQLLSTILNDDKLYHILITATKNPDKEQKEDESCVVPIAAISFCSNSENKEHHSLMIAACAVSDGNFTKSFGFSADGSSWRCRGLFRFLLGVARKLHQSIHHYTDELWTYVALRPNYSCFPIFQKLGFAAVAHNFKDCFAYHCTPYCVTKDWPERPSFVPFLAEGAIYGCADESFTAGGKLVARGAHVTPLSELDDDDTSVDPYDFRWDGQTDIPTTRQVGLCIYCFKTDEEGNDVYRLTDMDEWDCVSKIILVSFSSLQRSASVLRNRKNIGVCFIICSECSASHLFVAGTQCSMVCREGSEGFSCSNGLTPIHLCQRCCRCGQLCHLQCSHLVQGGNTTKPKSLFQGHFDLICLRCRQFGNGVDWEGVDPFGSKYWSPQICEATKLPPILFDYPFPMSYSAFVSSLPDFKAKNLEKKFWGRVKKFFILASGIKEPVEVAQQQYSAAIMDSWEPQVVGSRTKPFTSFCNGDIGENEKQKWEKFMPSVSNPVPFMRWGAKITVDDLTKMRCEETLLFSLNVVDFVISLFHGAAVESQRNNGRLFPVTCFPLSFTYALFQSFQLFGRRGTARFSSFVYHYDNGKTMGDIFNKQKVVLLPFRDLATPGLFLGIVLLHHLTEGSVDDACPKVQLPLLRVIRYGRIEHSDDNVAASYVSVLRDFVDMMLMNSRAFKEKTVGSNLHSQEAYFPRLTSRKALLQVVVNRTGHNSERIIPHRKRQTMYLLDDIMYFFLNEQSITPVVVDKLRSQWGTNAAPALSDDILEGVEIIIKSMSVQYFEAICEKFFPTFYKFIQWIENPDEEWTTPGTVNEQGPSVTLGMIKPYTRWGMQFVKYLYESNLIEAVNEKSFTMFMRNLTVFSLKESREARLVSSDAMHCYEFGAIKCEACKQCQIAGLPPMEQFVTIPLPHAHAEYKKMLCYNQELIVKEAVKIWDECTGSKTFGNESFCGVADYLQKKHDEIYDEIFEKLASVTANECCWHVTAMFELVQLLTHKYHPPPATAIVCTNSKMLRMLLEQEIVVKVPNRFERIVCTAHENNHHVILDVRRLSRQIFVYDGCDPSLAVDEEKTDSNVKRTATGSLVHTFEPYCKDLLTIFSLLKTVPKIKKSRPSTLAVASTTKAEDIRDVKRTIAPGAKDKWLLVPAQLFQEDGVSKKLIWQDDRYSCGPIAILHLMMALGIAWPTTGLNVEEPDYASVVMSLPWDDMIGEWLKDCLNSNVVVKEHREFYNIDTDVDEQDGNQPPVDDQQSQQPAPPAPNGDGFSTLDNAANSNLMSLTGVEEGAPNSQRYPVSKQFKRFLRDLRSELKVRIQAGSKNAEYWRETQKLELRVQIPTDDVNPKLEVKGCPAYVQPVFVSDGFPIVTMIRFMRSINKWEMKLPSYGKESQVVATSEAFLRFIFNERFIRSVIAVTDIWHETIYKDYRLDNTARLENIVLEQHNNDAAVMDPLVEGQRRKDLHELANKYFFTGPVNMVQKLKQVITHRPNAVKELILSTLTEYQKGKLNLVGSRVQYVCSSTPHWYASTWTREAGVVVRRITQYRVMNEFPIVTVQKAIGDPYHWVAVDKVTTQTLMRWDVPPSHSRLPDSVVDFDNQISMVMFRPKEAALEKVLEDKFPDLLGKGVKYGFAKGWYLGSTDGDPSQFELLEYDWVCINLEEKFRKLLLQPGWSNRWVTLPAGSGRDNHGKRKSRKTASKSSLPTLENTMVFFFERHYPRLSDASIETSWPVIHHKQGMRDRTCMFMSMASALHYLSFVWNISLLRKVAGNIRNYALYEARRTWTCEERYETLKQIIGGVYENKNKTIEKVGCPALLDGIGFFNEKHTFDPLSNQQMLPTLAVCESVDGGREHAVTFVGPWIFDSNEERALPISQESLNRCVPYGFKRVVLAYRFGKKLPEAQAYNDRKRKKSSSKLQNDCPVTKRRRR